MSKPSSRNIPAVHEAAPMEQVRELLFGAQLKDMDIKMQRQSELFSREIKDASDALKKRLDSLENFMNSEVSSLLARLKEEQREREAALKIEARERNEALKSEQRERVGALKQLSKDLTTATENFERRLERLSSSLDNLERELRQLLLNESGSLNDKIEARYKDALNVISKTAAQIRSDMVYRTALSGIYTEAVMQLNTPWNQESSRVDGTDTTDTEG